MDIENEFENMLNERADGIDVRPDLEGAMQDSRVIRTSPSSPTHRTSPLLLVSAGIAASLIVGLIGLVLLSGDDSPSAPIAVKPTADFYPVLGELPESIPQNPYASINPPFPDNRVSLTAFVGQLQDDQWTFVSRITVHTDYPDLPLTGGSEVNFDDLTVYRIDVGEAAVSIFMWQELDLWVTVITELPDPTQLLHAVKVTQDEEQYPQLTVGDLPTDFTVVAGPSPTPNTSFPSLSSDDAINGEAPTTRIDMSVMPGEVALALDIGTLDLVEVNNAHAYLLANDDRAKVIWELGENRTAVLSTLGLTRDETLTIARGVSFVDAATWREIYDLDRRPDVPATTIPIEPTTTQPSITATPTTIVTTPTTIPEPEQPSGVAWSEAEAERYVMNFLAALAAGAYEQAAWSAFNNGIIVQGQTNDELPAEAFKRLCAGGSCSGPYSVHAEGPGLVDPEFSYATSTLTITHIASGAQKSIQIGTFEGQLIIAQLPPLVPSTIGPTLVESLFGEEIPLRVVVQRFDAFEIWENGQPEWVTHWLANDTYQIEGDVVTTFERLASLHNPQLRYEGTCARLMVRDGEVLALTGCNPSNWGLVEVTSGEPRSAPFPYGETGEVESAWITERGGTAIHGTSDAEGNSVTIRNLNGVDLLGDDYSSIETLSTDGSLLAYVDHRDPAAHSHFWSGVVVLKDASTGTELGRWVLDNPVICLEFAESWIVACESGGIPEDFYLEQLALVAINVDTGEINRIETPVRIFLPS